MIEKPKKNAVQAIIKNLIDSEIPEIQNTAKQLSEWTKQLEEHSWKLQHYATEIEDLVEVEGEISSEPNLAALLKDLEKTIDELKQKPESVVEKQEDKEEAEEIVVSEIEEEREEREEIPLGGMETYITPEGFRVKRRR